MKTPFTEEEINELCDLYHNYGEVEGLSSALKILENDLKLYKVHYSVIAIRKHIIERLKFNNNNLENKYPNSTLLNKLSIRLGEEENDKKENK